MRALTPTLGRPVDVSLDGYRSDWLFNYVTVGIIVCFAVMCATMLWALIVHRARAGRRATYTHGTARRHLLLTGVVTAVAFVGIDGVALYHSARDLTEGFWKFPTAAEDPLRVEVWAQQWAWNIRYAGADGTFGTADDVVTLNDLRVPVGRPVLVKLRSKDVIHSFYLPNFRIKQDAVPGSTTQLWFQAQKTGRFEIACAQHCGVSHYKMKGTITITTPEAFAAWEREESRVATQRHDADDVEANWAWAWER